MTWTIKEDEIVCNFYLKYRNSWKSNIRVVMNELKSAGFSKRDPNSVKMRLSNYEYLDTGKGLSNAAKQSADVYNRMTNK